MISFIDVAADQRFTAVVPDRGDADNVYVIFNDINSILPMHLRRRAMLVCEGSRPVCAPRCSHFACRMKGDDEPSASLSNAGRALDFKPSSFPGSAADLAALAQ